MSDASFAQILETKMQIGSSVNKAAPQVHDPAYLSFLLGQLSRAKVSSQSSLGRYQKIGKSYASSKGSKAEDTSNDDIKTSPKKEEIKRNAHALTSKQSQALDLFNTWGADLGTDFLASELKQAFRKLARRHHPDVCTNLEKDGKTFMQIKAAYDELRLVF